MPSFLWAYLNQPLFDSRLPFVANLLNYRRQHRIGYLQRCWQQPSRSPQP